MVFHFRFEKLAVTSRSGVAALNRKFITFLACFIYFLPDPHSYLWNYYESNAISYESIILVNARGVNLIFGLKKGGGGGR